MTVNFQKLTDKLMANQAFEWMRMLDDSIINLRECGDFGDWRIYWFVIGRQMLVGILCWIRLHNFNARSRVSITAKPPLLLKATRRDCNTTRNNSTPGILYYFNCLFNILFWWHMISNTFTIVISVESEKSHARAPCRYIEISWTYT